MYRARANRGTRAAPLAPGGAAEVVEVQVRRQHQVDVAGGESDGVERVVEVPGAVEGVDLAGLLPHLVPGAAVHEHASPGRLDEHRPHRQLDPVAIVGPRERFPQGARDHAEHRAAVEPEGSVVQQANLQVAAGQAPDVQADRGAAALFQLHQHAVGRRRVDEGDQRPFRPGPRSLVHEPDAALLQVRPGRQGCRVRAA
jgi:hypothetical protein